MNALGTERKTVRLEKELRPEHLVRFCMQDEYGMVLLSNTASSGVKDSISSFDFLAGFGCAEEVQLHDDPFEAVFNHHSSEKDWLFGHFGYGLKELHHKKSSRLPDHIGFPKMSFFRPKLVVTGHNGICELHYLPEPDIESSVQRFRKEVESNLFDENKTSDTVDLQPRTSKDEYLEHAKRILGHIHRGDIYEANYCIEFFSENTRIDPAAVFLRLNSISPMPFAAFYKSADRFLLSASPEKFLSKTGQKVVSQPIKGTMRRSPDAVEDQKLREQLRNSNKERAENVMITDLVRNDLSIHAARGSVRVKELFQVKSFRSVHQLVTTVSADIAPGHKWTDVIRDAFPMGSMTGAPKKRAMEIIEEHEDVARGLYSGSVGYVSPEGNFDFNVVIRSIQYYAASSYVSAMAGSALTSACDPEQEYAECLLKMETMKKALG
jgi:para-aminobenzoate synthetase component 1